MHSRRVKLEPVIDFKVFGIIHFGATTMPIILFAQPVSI